MTLRLVHDPDTGCVQPAKWCPFVGESKFGGFACAVQDDFVKRDVPAPPWCPLRAGDVVVTAGKDGG